MRTIFYILQKEFIQIFRNRTMLPIIFVMPIVQLIILVPAATMEMKKIDMMVIDMDLSSVSRKLVNKFNGSPFFVLQQSTFSVKEGEDALKRGDADVVLIIPPGLEERTIRKDPARVQLLIDAINGTEASLINVYCSSIISEYSGEVISDISGITIPVEDLNPVSLTSSFWYNPELDYKIYMLPGMLVILVTIIGMFLSALNLVREKEMGTTEQINVTPIRKYQFIIGKLMPFWIIALFDLLFGLAIGYILYRIPIEGSLLLLFGFTSVYLFVALGIGLLISTLSSTQQQVMFLNFFFVITFIMMSGLFTPVESMPEWAQKANIINPLAYFMRVIRMVLLKGSGFMDILNEMISLGIYAIIIFVLATWRYKKVA